MIMMRSFDAKMKFHPTILEAMDVIVTGDEVCACMVCVCMVCVCVYGVPETSQGLPCQSPPTHHSVFGDFCT